MRMLRWEQLHLGTLEATNLQEKNPNLKPLRPLLASMMCGSLPLSKSVNQGKERRGHTRRAAQDASTTLVCRSVGTTKNAHPGSVRPLTLPLCELTIRQFVQKLSLSLPDPLVVSRLTVDTQND